MKTKRYFQWMFLAAMVVGAGMVASCSDDDDDNETKQTEQNVDDAEGMSELADDQLRDLVCRWCDVQKDELEGTAWQQQTFEPTEGVVADASVPAVRSLAVGTLEAADEYAAGCLATLGIDADHPDGFTFTDAKVGAVAYRHSSDGNTLAVIDVDVKQMPGLQQIRLVKDWPVNAGGDPYYTAGDVVKYKNRLYICVSEHKKNEKAVFVTLNDYADHSIGYFSWRGVGKDTVYNDDMASPETLALWLKNVVCNEETLEFTRDKLESQNYSNDEINQVVPATEPQRLFLLSELADIYHLIIEATKPQEMGGPFASGAYIAQSFTWMTLKDNADDEFEVGFDVNAERNIRHLVVAPAGHLLTKKPRWRMNFGKWDQWQPYIYLVRESGYADMKQALDMTPCESTLSPGHFQWRDIGTFTLKKAVESIPESTKGTFKAGTYHVLMVAMYWQHEIVFSLKVNNRILWNFTKDWGEHPRGGEMFKADMRYWYRRAITSSEMTFTDKGTMNSKLVSVFVNGEGGERR